MSPSNRKLRPDRRIVCVWNHNVDIENIVDVHQKRHWPRISCTHYYGMTSRGQRTRPRLRYRLPLLVCIGKYIRVCVIQVSLCVFFLMCWCWSYSLLGFRCDSFPRISEWKLVMYVLPLGNRLTMFETQ